MHEQPALRRMALTGNARYPVAETLARRGFYVPCGLSLTEKEIDRVATTLLNILQVC